MSINLKTTSAMESQIDKALKKMKSMTVTTREDYVMEALKYFNSELKRKKIINWRSYAVDLIVGLLDQN